MNDRDTSSKWISDDGRYSVKIRNVVLRRMRDLAVKHAPNEVGTALVGSYSDDGHSATVHDLAPLTTDSKGSRFSFVRGVHHLPAFFSAVYRKSKGRRHYVGEWHSHPNGSAASSQTDDHNQTAIANDHDTDCPEAILVILGGDNRSFPDIAAFVYSRTAGRVALHPQQLEANEGGRLKQM